MQYLKNNILKASQNNEKLADHNLKDLCRWSLALATTIPVLGPERVCSRKVGPWPRVFFSSPGLGLEGCVLDSTCDKIPLENKTFFQIKMTLS